MESTFDVKIHTDKKDYEIGTNMELKMTSDRERLSDSVGYKPGGQSMRNFS